MTFAHPMKQAIASLIAATLSVGMSSQLQRLSDDQIKEAIVQGTAGKNVTSSCLATSGFMDFGEMNGPFDVYVEGPYGRIMRLAREAKKKYLAFTIETVTDEQRATVVTITITPAAPTLSQNKWHRTAAADHVVLKTKPPKGAEAVVLQPANIEHFPTEWSNAVGGKWQGQGAVATFDFDAVKGFPHPEFDVVVITAEGERRCKVGKKDRDALR